MLRHPITRLASAIGATAAPTLTVGCTGATNDDIPVEQAMEHIHVLGINHEVGHSLGYPHQACSARGQPAPVMLQQTIRLDGCTRNPWPDHAGQ